MTFISKHSKLNTVILVLFAIAWLYTEVTEYIKRDDFKLEIIDFMERTDSHHKIHHPEAENEAILEK